MSPTFSIILIFFGTFLVPSFARPDKSIGKDSPYYVACGGALNNTYSTISYKSDVSVNQNERCVWTIRSPTASSYTLEVTTFGLQTQLPDIGLMATCISKDGNRDIMTKSVQITSSGMVNITSTCHLLIITYYSGENIQQSRGFSMFYDSVPGNSGVSPNSQHYVVNTVQGHVRNPLNVEQNYTSHELSTFIYAPLDNIYDPERKTVVAFVEDSIEGGCYDYVILFKFNPSRGWTSSHSICSGIGYEKWESDDLILVLFISDSSNFGRGFHLVHSHELLSHAKNSINLNVNCQVSIN